MTQEYKVEYYAPFHGEWREYIAPTWGAREIRHRSRGEAEARMARLMHDHPRDQFRITEV